MINILITGVGAPGIKGTIFCLANNPDKMPLYLVGVDLNPKAVGQFFVDRFYTVPSPESEEYLEAIKEIVLKEKIQIIIPQTTRETFFYAKNKSFFEAMNVKVIVVSYEAASLANNKYLTLQACEQAGLTVGRYYLIHTLEELHLALKKLHYPHKKIIVKIPVSNGMRGFRILTEEPISFEKFLREKPSSDQMSLKDFMRMLEAVQTKFPPMLIMEYLPGAEYSVDIFRSEKEICIIPRLREEIRSGISFVNKIENHAEIIRLSKIAAEALGLMGVFGFQFKLDGYGSPKLLECNPRVQGTMVASFFANANIIWYGVANTLNIPYQVTSHPKWGVAFRRYWGGVGIDDDSCLYKTI